MRGGRFVAGFSGEQYALPAAMDGLKADPPPPRTGERVTVNACDPLNLTGVVIRGPRTPAVRTNTVTYVDGATADPAAPPAGPGARRAVGDLVALSGPGRRRPSTP